MAVGMKKVDRVGYAYGRTPPKRKLRDSPYIDMARNEEWRATEFENIMVSSKGRVKRKGRIAKQHINQDGYCTVCIGRLHKLVHRLVAKAFCENPNDYPVVDHIDGCKTNNDATNLRWCTVQQNTQWNYDSGYKASNEKKLVLAYEVATQTVRIFKTQADAARFLNVNGNVVSSVIDKDKTTHGYKFFRMIDIDVMDSLNGEYYGVTTDGGVWAEKDEGGIRIKIVDNRDNPMSQPSIIKLTESIHKEVKTGVRK